jgi:penicillin amidase
LFHPIGRRHIEKPPPLVHVAGMKRIARIALFLFLALLGSIGILVWWLSTSVPSEDATVRLPGLAAKVTVGRDAYGVPRIQADNVEDAYFALGFLHAEDRLWQMEIQRRLGAGRLAEVMGAKALPTDRFMRTLGLYRLAEQSLAALSPEVREALDAYAAGVNAYLTGHSGALPGEFLLLRFSPEPWRAADSLVWGRLMALQLAGNWQDELLHAKLATMLAPLQIEDLWPTRSTPQPGGLGFGGPFLDRMLAAIPAAAERQTASNVWAIAGERSVTGKPILANDPHLGFQAPILWYLASVSAPGLSVAGATVPGVPFHLLGHNRRIAWGMTTTQSDVMDLFIEQTDGPGYRTPEGPAPFAIRNEIIKVRGAPDDALVVRQTRHGPIVSDLLGERAEGRLLALSATALLPDDRTAQALYRLNRAQSWDDFTAALTDFHSPQQNIAYADVDGHIGMLSPGLVPIRRSGDGRVPAQGWSGTEDWTGWIADDALPRVFDPPSGRIVNANNQIVPDDYPYLLSADWPDAYRAQRIIQRLDAQPRHSADDMSRLQQDELSLMAADLWPLLRRAPARDSRAGAVLAMLDQWSFVADRTRPEPLIFEAWLVELQRSLLEPWLGAQTRYFQPIRPAFLKAVLTSRHSLWCARPNTSAVVDCDERVADALERTLDGLSERFGPHMEAWQWGAAHRATFDALLYRYIPGLAEATRLSAPTGGDDFTIQRGSFTNDDLTDFHHVHGAGLRAVYDLSDLDASRFVIATGQSGNPFSSHWHDMLPLWRDGRWITLENGQTLPHLQILEPARSP